MRFKDRIGNILPESVLRLIRPIYYGTVGRFYGLADAYGLIGPDKIYDQNYYAKRKRNPWRSDAHEIARVLFNQFEPHNVIDFGCAIGAHLEYFHTRDIEVQGVEGSEAALKHAVIPTEKISLHDLREFYQSEKKFDLATCFEVAEHLPERFSDTLIDSLVDSSDTIVMTAAPPGQAGTHHVNLQPREYWIEKFNDRGFVLDQRYIATLRKNIELEKMDWIHDNLFVFRQESENEI